MATGDVRHIMDMILNSDNQLPLPFTQTPILVNGQDMMSRTFYVDAENGDDNNDGSQSAPFKTIKKACDSVPVGGIGYINLVDGQTYNIDDDFNIIRKNIYIYASSSNKAILQIKGRTVNISGSDYATVSCIHLGGSSSLHFYGCDIRIEAPGDNLDVYLFSSSNNFSGSFVNHNFVYDGNLSVLFDYCKITCYKNNNGKSFGLVQNPTYAHHGIFSVSFHETSTYSDNPIIHLRTGVVAFRSAGYYHNLNGDNIDVSDIFSGINKDANGVPRNVISNVIL